MKQKQTWGRGSRSQMFFKIDVLKNLPMLTGKHLYWTPFFNKVAGLQACNFIKKWLQHKCFSMNFAKFLRTTFLQKIYSGGLKMREMDYKAPKLNTYEISIFFS